MCRRRAYEYERRYQYGDDTLRWLDYYYSCINVYLLVSSYNQNETYLVIIKIYAAMCGFYILLILIAAVSVYEAYIVQRWDFRSLVGRWLIRMGHIFCISIWMEWKCEWARLWDSGKPFFSILNAWFNELLAIQSDQSFFLYFRGSFDFNGVVNITI